VSSWVDEEFPKPYSRPAFHAAEKTSAALKINGGRCSELTLKDVRLLFDVIDKDNNGLLDFEEIRSFLKEVLVPPCTQIETDAIYRLTDQNNDGWVTPEEIFKALTSTPVKQHFKQLHNEDQVRRRFDETLGRTAEVDRAMFVQRVRWRVRTDDAFRSLPFSACYLLIFISVVTAHLQIWRRQQIERGLEAWMVGYGKDLLGPYLLQAVGNVDGMGVWLRDSGLAAVFGECRNNTGGQPFCHLATRNVLLGDVELQQTRKDGSRPSEWLLHGSQQARADMAAHPRDFLGVAAARVRHLWESRWADEDTDEVRLAFSTYNGRAKMFAVTEVVVGFRLGLVTPAVVASAVVVDPYPDYSIFALDGLYCCLLLGPLYSELKDLVMTCRHRGVAEGFVTYLGFWNLIDWLTILIGAMGVAVWVLCCLAMQDGSIHELLDGRTRALVTNIMQIDTERLTEAKEALGTVIRLFFWLHFVMAANVVTIMLKFFKSFQANPRLHLVTDTIARAGDDMFHWAVVFAAIFLGFALSGNILFGPDLVQFCTMGSSLNTAFSALMGDFGWYVEKLESDEGLPSGMPLGVLALWFWVFMILVMLILLNMLLAIILEHYAELLMQLKNQDVPSLMAQTWGFVRQFRRERGFVPMYKILHLLEDEDEPVHLEDRVTSASLMKAFTMKDEQAEVLMDWLQQEATERQRKAEGGVDMLEARLEAIEGFAQALSQQLRVVSLNASTLLSRVHDGLGRPKRVQSLRRRSGNWQDDSSMGWQRGTVRRRTGSSQDDSSVGYRNSGASMAPTVSHASSTSCGKRASSPQCFGRTGQPFAAPVQRLAQQAARQRNSLQELARLATELTDLAARAEQRDQQERQRSADRPAVQAGAQLAMPPCFSSAWARTPARSSRPLAAVLPELVASDAPDGRG